jgi:pyrimidine operon attenuation protein/uracil phosphoribosyltransferase
MNPLGGPEGVFFLAFEMEKRVLLEGEEIQRILNRMAHEVVEKSDAIQELALIGIRSRGAHLVRRIAKKIETLTGNALPVGIIDISPYRDDLPKMEATPDPALPKAPITIDEKTLVLVDDVIYTGRTMRAAIGLAGCLGKPRKILVAVLVDRGQRELPIKADIIGKNVEVGESERVNVLLEESDGIDQVIVAKLHAASVRTRP